MAQKTGTIHIKWVRSGIGFPRRQKNTVKSLGLRRLNQVVERPDTAHIRGLVAKIPHLVAIVDAPAIPAWAKLPEYKIVAAETRPASKPSAPKASKKEAAAEAPAAPEKAERADVAPKKKSAAKPKETAASEAAAPETAAAAPRKRTRSTKSSAAESAKEASATPEKGKRRRKATEKKPKAEE